MMCVNDLIYKGPNVAFACCHIALSYFYHTWLFKRTDLIKCTFYRMCPILRFFIQWHVYDIWGCAISWVISLLMTVRIIVIYITIIKSEIGIISHRIGFDDKTMVCAAYIAILYLLIFKSIFTIISYVHRQLYWGGDTTWYNMDSVVIHCLVVVWLLFYLEWLVNISTGLRHGVLYMVQIMPVLIQFTKHTHLDNFVCLMSE